MNGPFLQRYNYSQIKVQTRNCRQPNQSKQQKKTIERKMRSLKHLLTNVRMEFNPQCLFKLQ